MIAGGSYFIEALMLVALGLVVSLASNNSMRDVIVAFRESNVIAIFTDFDV